MSAVQATVRTMTTSTRAALGQMGQDAAERWYVGRGYRVVARNWRCSVGELDLVLTRGRTVIICEVKTRRGSRFGGGFEAVDARKRRKLRAVAEVYLLHTHAPAIAIRFDVASVAVRAGDSAGVQVFEDAF